MSPVRRWRRTVSALGAGTSSRKRAPAPDTGAGSVPRTGRRWHVLPPPLAGRWRSSRQALALVLLALALAAGASSASLASPNPSSDPSTGGSAALPLDPSLPYTGPGAPYPPDTIVPTLTGAPNAGQQLQGPGASDAAAAQELAANGIPLVALAAYRNAERRLARDLPGCGLTWSLLAAIGRVESNHGRFAGAQLLQDGRSQPPIIGIALDGRAGARIPDTDRGRLDGDPVFDHAVGPMQFIPSTWQMFAVDANSDGVANPFDINDAALAAGDYLCQAGENLRTPAGLSAAILSYNHSEDYVRLVLDLKAEYEAGIRVNQLPAGTPSGGRLPKPHKPPLPPVNPAPPPAAKPDPTTTPPSTSPPGSTPPPTTTAQPTTTPAPTTTPPGTTSPTPTPTPTSTCPTPTPTPTDTPTPTPTPTVTPTPGPCDPTTTAPSTSPPATGSAANSASAAGGAADPSGTATPTPASTA